MRVWKQRGMQTMQDWPRYYNDLNVEPSLEALQKMTGFYLQREIDILKDVVSIPRVSM